ncbi:Endonuclease/exonuclease/phosphatase [Xylariaceae sp. FL0255]|nr:Endonuclease/exonuclease/phosphatase [Xylariaceae sp. FL0255]
MNNKIRRVRLRILTYQPAIRQLRPWPLLGKHISKSHASLHHPNHHPITTTTTTKLIVSHHLKMDQIIQRAIEQTRAATRARESVPWEEDKPYPQQIHTFDISTQTWKPSPSCTPTPKGETGAAGQDDEEITHLAVLSWNIDYMLPHAQSRMEAGLSELRRQIDLLPRSTAAAIFLQECVLSDLRTIATAEWVREGFRVTDRRATNWGSGMYGTTTLVDRRLGVESCFRVHYAASRPGMDRDGLFVDVVVPSKGDGKGKGKVVRLCNSHLESLALEPPFRPIQVGVMARFMHGAGEGEDGKTKLCGAIAAGDFNAIQPFDRTLHSDNGLTDAYIALGGAEDDEAGYTWGQQASTALRKQFGCSRMDKVYLTSSGWGGLKLERFDRFGTDVELDDPAMRQEIVELGFEKGWITDHLGVMAVVEVV